MLNKISSIYAAYSSEILWRDAKETFKSIRDTELFLKHYSLYQYLGAQSWIEKHSGSRFTYYATVAASRMVEFLSRIIQGIALSFRASVLLCKAIGQSLLASAYFLKEKILSASFKIVAMIEKAQGHKQIERHLSDCSDDHSHPDDHSHQKDLSLDSEGETRNSRKGSFCSITSVDIDSHEHTGKQDLPKSTAADPGQGRKFSDFLHSSSPEHSELDTEESEHESSESRSRGFSFHSVESVAVQRNDDTGSKHANTYEEETQKTILKSDEETQRDPIQIICEFYNNQDPKYVCYSSRPSMYLSRKISGLRGLIQTAINNDNNELLIKPTSKYADFVAYYKDQELNTFGVLSDDRHSPDTPALNTTFCQAVIGSVKKIKAANKEAKENVKKKAILIERKPGFKPALL